tara:strand:- start:112 stop:330 length:219 start_codon:yes stop_codon:yes gene_type:complete
MQKNYFHNNKHTSEKNDQKKFITVEQIKQKRKVDINKLLNRVRIEKKNENKRTIIFYSSIILTISTFTYIIY